VDALTKAALIGAARHGDASPETGTPIDTLDAGLAGRGRERRLLLTAGALAVYRQAGRIADAAMGTAGIAPAPADDRPALSPPAARLVEAMFAGEREELLPEALDRARRAGLRLPHRLLPAALSARLTASRAAILPVLGARGVWLAQFNRDWEWAAQAPLGLDDDDVLSADAATLWEEGTPARRLEILRRVRRTDQARARGWIEGVWRTEKADYRTRLIETLEDALSADDEPFLEAALDDRSAGVRKAAARLLALIPGSAFLVRTRDRGDALLTRARSAPRKGLGALLAAVSQGSNRADWLRVALPESIDSAWQRDGVDLKPPQGVGERAWWLTETIAYLPPDHWVDHLGAEPSDLIVAASDNTWSLSVLEGWARAASLHKNMTWIVAFWEAWRRARVGGRDRDYLARLLPALIETLPQREIERLVEQLLVDESFVLDEQWIGVLRNLTEPWDARFATSYLHALRRYSEEGSTPRQTWYAWPQTLPIAARSLPPSCFPRALAPWPEPEAEGNDWRALEWRRQRQTFVETIEIRQQIEKGIPL